MKKRYLVTICLAAVVGLGLAACVGTQPGTPGTRPWGPAEQPGGMMGGMMGAGMMGGRGAYDPSAEPPTMAQAADSVRRYLEAYGEELVLKEIMEFTQNFYAEVEEKSTSVHAMELLIDKHTGQVFPERGPNMMWNTKYGTMAQMMGGRQRVRPPSMSVGPEEARFLATRFLEGYLPGATVGQADAFYGYYTLHALRDGQIEGMLSVNGYSGAVWYHTWHGAFIGMEELDSEGGH